MSSLRQLCYLSTLTFPLSRDASTGEQGFPFSVNMREDSSAVKIDLQFVLFSHHPQTDRPGSQHSCIRILRFQTATILHVARISCIGSPSTSTRSVCIPGQISPRSVKWNRRAGMEVAAANACIGVIPSSTSNIGPVVELCRHTNEVHWTAPPARRPLDREHTLCCIP